MKLPLAIVLVAAVASSRAAYVDEGGLDLLLLIDRSGSMTTQNVQPLVVLATDVVARNGDANRIIHRLGVVSFGSKARIDMALRPIAADWRDRLRALDQRTSGYTNVLEAFETAAGLFDQKASRRRAILLITDGVPSLPTTSANDHERALERSVAAAFRDVTIDVVLLPHGGPKNTELWHTVARGRAHEVADAASFHEVVTALVGTHSKEVVSDKIVLPPYLAFVAFDIFQPRGGNVSVFAGELLSPTAAPPLSQYARTEISYRVVDRRGRPLVELPGYPLNLEAILVGPDGRSVSLPMARSEIDTSTFRGADAITCDAVGRYWTEIKVTTVDALATPCRGLS